eukprot:938146-Rhodomonas_salina.1
MRCVLRIPLRSTSCTAISYAKQLLRTGTNDYAVPTTGEGLKQRLKSCGGTGGLKWLRVLHCVSVRVFREE